MKYKECPNCNSKNIVMFDSNNDLCKDCGKWFHVIDGIYASSLEQDHYIKTYYNKIMIQAKEQINNKIDREVDWKNFSKQVEKHIKQYAIPQYMNSDTKLDQVAIWTSEECIKAIQRYISRYGKNLRGNTEALRDLIKIAHYASFAYDKLKKELKEKNVYE